jgi:hypothetical protein
VDKKPRIVLIYGYHPEEIFGITVGKVLKHQYKNKNENLLIKEYDGVNPRTVDDRILGSQDRGRLLNEYVHELGEVDYLIDLHDESPWPKTKEEKEGLLKKYPLMDRTKGDPMFRMGFPSLAMFNCSRGNFDPNYKQEIIEYCLSNEPEYVTAAYFAENRPETPKEWEQITIGYYPHHIDIPFSVKFVKDLLNILQKY